MDVLRGFKRIQRVYLYNHQHAPPLPTSEVKILLLQGNSTIQTLGVSGYTDKHGRTIDIWRVRGCSLCHRFVRFLCYLFRPTGHTTQSSDDHEGTSFGVRNRQLRVWLPCSRSNDRFYCPVLYCLIDHIGSSLRFLLPGLLEVPKYVRDNVNHLHVIT